MHMRNKSSFEYGTKPFHIDGKPCGTCCVSFRMMSYLSSVEMKMDEKVSKSVRQNMFLRQKGIHLEVILTASSVPFSQLRLQAPLHRMKSGSEPKTFGNQNGANFCSFGIAFPLHLSFNITQTIMKVSSRV